MNVVVYDLEYTTWEGAQARRWSGPGEHREIVQIGAVKLDDDWQEIAAMELLVRPQINPTLSDYFIALTGISQAEVDRSGMDFAEAQNHLANFSGLHTLLYANGKDAEVLQENCRLLAVPEAFTSDRFRDVRALIGAMAGKDAVNSCDIATTFDLKKTGRGHSGLADARAVAAALRLALGRGFLDQSGAKAFL